MKGFPGGSDGKERQETRSWIPGLGRSPGEGDGKPLQYSCLGNPIDRGAWQKMTEHYWTLLLSRMKQSQDGSAIVDEYHTWLVLLFEYLFWLIYLAAPGLSCNMWALGSLLWHANSYLWWVGSSSPNRNRTWVLSHVGDQFRCSSAFRIVVQECRQRGTAFGEIT